MKSLLKLMLNIKKTVIEHIEIIGGPDIWNTELILHVHPTKGQQLRCPHCHKKAPYYDEGQGSRRWRTLDLGVIRVYLKAKAPRVCCTEHKVVVASVPWARHNSWFTKAFEEQVTWMVLHATRSVVAEYFRIEWKTVGSIIARVQKDKQASAPDPFDGLINIGIDETSHKKGHKYLTVVVNHDTGCVIWAAKNHGKGVLTKFFKMLTEQQRASIEVVTGDGAGWITECVEEFCPNATRLLDNFHIVSWATDALDSVRRRAWNEAKAMRPAQKYPVGRPKKGEVRPIDPATEIKGLRFALLKNPEDLSQAQTAKIDMLALQNSQMYRAYLLKERLRLLLKMDVEDASVELKSWLSCACRCRIPEFVELSKKIRRHAQRIIDTIRLGFSNARVEAINNKIKVTTKMGYGFRNIDNLIALIMLRCSGLPFELPGHRPQAATA